MVIYMNFKKTLLTIIVCGLIAVSAVSCSFGGDAEVPRNDTTVSSQAETNEKGEAVTASQADSQQNDGAVSDDEFADAENSDTNSKSENSSNNSSNDSKNKNTDVDDNDNESEKTDETDSTNHKSDDDKTTDDGEDPVGNVEVVFDEDDFEF